jgi:DNA-binding MarR family transcriptional regulator
MNPAQQQLAEAFKAVTVAMRRMRGRQTHRHNGLSYAQYGLLFALEGGGALSARDLGEAASLAPASVTQMLDGLEAGGLVVRSRSAEDKRVVLTELTEQGRAAIAEMRARTEPAWSAALAEFSDRDLHRAAAVLERLAEYFTRLAETPQTLLESSDAVGVGGDHVA